jgi:long-subunit acyl-CoA synthetase (AMP-forming)
MIPLHHIFRLHRGVPLVHLLWQSSRLSDHDGTTDLFMAIKKAPVTHLYSVPMFWDAVAQKSSARRPQRREDRTMLDNLVAYNNHQISRRKPAGRPCGFVKRAFQKKVFGTQIEYCISGGGYLSQKTLSTSSTASAIRFITAMA